MSTTQAPDVIAFLRSLRAVREFRGDPVPHDAVRDLLDVARWSGSASNQQGWEMVLVRDRQTLAALGQTDGYAGHVAGAALGIVLVMAGGQPERSTFDEGRLSERLMLAAAAHGLGSSIGWFRGTGADEAARLLGIPADRLVRTVISIGYPTEEAARRGGRRRPAAEFAHWERYGQQEPNLG